MPEFCEAKSHRMRGAISEMKYSLGRNRMLRRGEFGAAVFEKRRSIQFRRAEIIDFLGQISMMLRSAISGMKNPLVRSHRLCPSRVRRSRV